MITVFRISRRRAPAAFVVFCALGLQAGTQAARAASGCPPQPVSQPFVRWMDFGSYASVPGGAFENGAAGWALRDQAAVVAGNEPYHVHAAADASSLALPSGSAAASPDVCVTLERPTIRFFVRNTGSPTAHLAITVRFTGPDGRAHALPVGTVTGTPQWQPTPIIPIGVNALSVIGSQQIGLGFAGAGGGNWSIDDVYVDPYGKG